jgi:dimethylsulfone monooxygenase
MWADSTFEDLPQYNDGFRGQSIGTPDLLLGGFPLPLMREIEASEQDSIDSPVLVSG